MQRTPLAFIALAAALCAAANCGGGGGTTAAPAVPFGLEQRITVTGLTFPVQLPVFGSLRAVRAFPGLSFARPLLLTHAPDGSGRLFVVEQDGRIRVFANQPGATTTKLFLDIASQVSRVGNEEGLLGLAFHPDYRSNGWFYLYYSIAGGMRTRLSRFTVSTADPDAADAASETVLLEIAQDFRNHNGGGLAFGPDGRLYLGTGDGGGANDPNGHAQDLGSLLGKVLRLADDGSVPADNPFAGQAGARGEIWAYGLRNPWRISFDRATGDLWAGDVGQNQVEEIDVVERGLNYGWPVYEGERSNVNPTNRPPSDFEAPVHTYTHGDGRSITGGYVYRGAALPALAGAYLYADFVSNRVWALVHDGVQVVSNVEIATVPLVASFGEDAAGEVYLCSFDGAIYKLEENPGPAPGFPQTLSATGLFSDTANLVAAPGLIEYEVNAPLWSDGATKRRWIALPGNDRIGFEPTGAWRFPAGTVIVKHFELGARRLDTRVLVKHDSGWQGYDYRWNAQGTDADLLEGSDTEDLGGQVWYFPSRADCLTCHTAAGGPILGVRTLQLNRDFDYAAATDNQLRAWNHIGLFTADIGAHTGYDAMPSPDDAGAPLARRARAYLAANCANCHSPGGPTPAELDLRYETPIARTNTLGVAAVGSPGLRIDPGSRETSVLWQRMGLLDALRMPPLASNVVDDSGRAVVGQWIDAGAGD